MKIEAEHVFMATHCHMIPPGVMSETHSHCWQWTVVIEGPKHPLYGWVANFDDVRSLMAKCAEKHFEGTAEQFLEHLVRRLQLELRGYLLLAWSRLEEKPGQAAIWDGR